MVRSSGPRPDASLATLIYYFAIHRARPSKPAGEAIFVGPELQGPSDCARGARHDGHFFSGHLTLSTLSQFQEPSCLAMRFMMAGASSADSSR